MSNFWALSDGANAAATKATEFDAGGGNMQPIPDGSTVLAMIDEAKWATKDGAEHISLRWTVIQPEAFKNRKVFQKLWVTDDDPGAAGADKAAKKRDKARRMLAAIDANAGGKLTSQEGKPTDESMTMHLTNKPMAIKAMVWEVEDRNTGDKVRGNWIAAVAPKTATLHIAEAAKASPSASSPRALITTATDLDIPF